MNPNTPRLGAVGANSLMSRDIDHTLHVRMDTQQDQSVIAYTANGGHLQESSLDQTVHLAGENSKLTMGGAQNKSTIARGSAI